MKQLELRQQHKQGEPAPVDLRDVKYVEGAGLVRVGPPEWASNSRETKQKVEGITDYIFYGK